MKKIYLLLILCIGFSFKILGQQIHPIEQSLQNCLAQEENKSVAKQTNCYNEAEQLWQDELDKYYLLLYRRLDSLGQVDLRRAQRQWYSFNEKESGFISTLFYKEMKGDGLKIDQAAKFRKEITRNRALQIQAYYERLRYNY